MTPSDAQVPDICIYVDADACPVKDEVYRVARRTGLAVFVVSNRRMHVPADPRITPIVVPGGLDEADDWIAARVGPRDIVVTADIPLADRSLKAGAKVLDARGRVFTEESIGSALASREILAFMRDLGEVTGGPPPFSPKDRSTFLQRLDDLIQALKRAAR